MIKDIFLITLILKLDTLVLITKEKELNIWERPAELKQEEDKVLIEVNHMKLTPIIRLQLTQAIKIITILPPPITLPPLIIIQEIKTATTTLILVINIQETIMVIIKLLNIEAATIDQATDKELLN